MTYPIELLQPMPIDIDRPETAAEDAVLGHAVTVEVAHHGDIAGSPQLQVRVTGIPLPVPVAVDRPKAPMRNTPPLAMWFYVRVMNAHVIELLVPNEFFGSTFQ